MTPIKSVLQKPQAIVLLWMFVKSTISEVVSDLIKKEYIDDKKNQNTTSEKNVAVIRRQKKSRAKRAAASTTESTTTEQTLSRQKRLAPGVIIAAKMLGWSVGMTVAGVGFAVAGAYAADYLVQQRENEPLKRARIDCHSNNAGCFENICFTNCGPRLMSSDWCYTATSIQKGSNNTVFAACTKDSDCDPCWPCASTCQTDSSYNMLLEDIMEKNAANNQKTTDNEIPIEAKP